MDKKKSYKWIVVDLIFMYIVTGLGLVLMAFLMDKFDFEGSAINIGIIVIYAVSSLIGGLIAGKKMKTKKFIWGLLMGAAYFLILFGISAAINGGLPKDFTHLLMPAAVCLAGGTLGGMIG